MDESKFSDFRNRLRGGEPTAFAELVSAMGARLYYAVAKKFHGQGGSVAEDAVQETLLNVWRYATAGKLKLNGVDSWGELSRWLCVIACRKACTAYGRQKRYKAFPDEAASLVPDNSAAAEAIEHVEQLERVNEAIEELPAKERDVVRMRHRDELTLKDIAVKLGTPAGTIQCRYFRAIARLRERLGMSEPAGAQGPDPHVNVTDPVPEDGVESQTEVEQ